MPIKTKMIVAVSLATISIISLFYVFGMVIFRAKKGSDQNQKIRIIDENLSLPQTETINSNEGRIIQPGNIDVPLDSGDEKIIVSKAMLSIKGAYNAVSESAKNWSPDAKLVFIRSLGAINPEGKSSQWQIIFGSRLKKKGYEIVIQADKIVLQKEVDVVVYGFDLPKNWYDTNELLLALSPKNLPQFIGATFSAISFYYNSDSKLWEYGVATSKGITSMIVK